MYQSVFQRYIFKQSTDRNKDIIITILKMIKTLGEEVKWLETEMDKQQEDQKSLKIENLEKMVANQKNNSQSISRFVIISFTLTFPDKI